MDTLPAELADEKRNRTPTLLMIGMAQMHKTHTASRRQETALMQKSPCSSCADTA
jgi:hypothetical protein